MRLLRIPTVYVVAALALLVSANGANAQSRAAPRPWAHEAGSDLPLDPRVRFGAVPAGLRYAWVHQPLPDDSKVYLRLHVAVGSLVESEAELGMAHFLEHMAFNGTRNFKAGTLIDWFQHHGVRFGHDQNASTSTDETIYELDLPDADPERLAKSLAWLRDVADGLLLEEKEVAAEKGIIDAEERERAGAGLRLLAQLDQRMIDGTLTARRWPIGKKSIRDKFNSAACKAFYKKWYRPEFMTLVVVGNLPDVDVGKLVTDAFATLPIAKEPLPVQPSPGTPKVSARAFCAFDKEQEDFTLLIGKVRAKVEVADTVAKRVARLQRNAALALVSTRIAKLGQLPNSPVQGASFGDWNYQDLLEGPALTVRCAPERWKEALLLAGRELRRTLDGEFTREEVRATYGGLNEYCILEPTAGRLPMDEYLGELLAAARGAHVPVDEVVERRLMKAVLPDLTAEKLHETVVSAWNTGELYVVARGGHDLGKDAAAQLNAAWEESQKPVAAGTNPADSGKTAPVTKEEAESDADGPVDFFYKAKGATGKLARQETDDALNVLRLEFENGVRVAFRPTVQENRGAAIYVRVGDGFLALDPSEADIGWAADRVFLASGLGEHTLTQLQKSLSGRQLTFGFDVTFDGCVFSGSSAPDDFQRLCEVICAYITDPGWRPEAFDEFNQGLPQLYEAMAHGFTGPLSQFEFELHGKDPRFATPDRELVESFLLDTLKEFLQPQLDEGRIEVAVVTGMDPTAVASIVARTFGMLPKRGDAEEHAERLQSPPIQSGLKFRREIETAEKKAHVAVVWPTGDGIDPARRHELEFLAAALDNRIRVEIREKKGAAYSPRARDDLSLLFPGVGAIRADVECDPSKADEVLNACLSIGDALAKNGVKQEEFEQARTLALQQIDQAIKQDGYWLVQLARATTNPQALAELVDAKASLKAITLESVNALAKQHFARAKASTAIVTPKKPEKKK